MSRNCRLPFTLLLFLLTVILAPLPADAELREWVSANGKTKVNAELISVKDGSVQLKRDDGKTFDVPLAKLSTADQSFVADLQAKQASPNAGKRITIPGIMSIGTPGNGFAWSSGGQRLLNGVQAYRIGCSKPDSKSSADLRVLLEPIRTDPHRQASITKHFQGLAAMLTKNGVTSLSKPSLPVQGGIPDFVQFGFTGTSATSEPIEFRIVHIFKQNTYSFFIAAESAAIADDLAAVARTVKELGSEPSAKVAQPTGRFRHRGYGFSFQAPPNFAVYRSPDKQVAAAFREPTGVALTFRCQPISAEFNLETVYEKIKAQNTDGLENFQDQGEGDMTVANRGGKWRLVSYKIKDTQLKVIQYYFASDKFVFIVTGTTKADNFDQHRAAMDAAVADVRFDVT